MFKLTLFILLLIWSLSPILGQSRIPGEEHVFMIRITEGGQKRVQTGFRVVEGAKGLITALHGVLKADAINALSVGNELYLDLEIVAVDFEKDIALLSSPLLETSETGLSIFTEIDLVLGDSLWAIGFPYEIDIHYQPVVVGRPTSKALRSFIPTPLRESYEKRASPDLNIQVLNLTGGPLVPGHSGAPVFLNNSHQVIAVGNGGLKGGVANISWAIPINSINLVSTKFDQTQKLLNRLREEKIEEELFNYEVIDNLISPVTQMRAMDYIGRYELKDLDIQSFYARGYNLSATSSRRDGVLKRIGTVKGKILPLEFDELRISWESSQNDVREVLQNNCQSNSSESPPFKPTGPFSVIPRVRSKVFRGYGCETKHSRTRFDLILRYDLDDEGWWIMEIKASY